MNRETIQPSSWRVGIAGLSMGIFAGALVAWGLANIGGSAIGFIFSAILVMLFLWRKPTAVGAIGSGLYVNALLLALVPIFFYIPTVFGAEEGTAEGAGMFIGSVIGLFLWTAVFFVMALVLLAIGYFFKRRESAKLRKITEQGTVVGAEKHV